MPGWEQLGMQAAGQVSGAILGLALGGINDRRQLNQQRRLQELQIKGDKELTDYNAMKQLEMWKNTSYPAQMAMLKQAGLNPALIYGSSGPGGMTNLATGNVASGNAPTGGGEIQSMMGMGLMNAMQAAQIENLKANTEKTRAEAGAIPTTQAKTAQETINLKTQNAIDELNKAFLQDTQTNRESLINLGLSKLIEEVKIIENDREISDKTKNDKIGIIQWEAINSILDGYIKQAQKENIDQSTLESAARIKQIAEQNRQNWASIAIDQQYATNDKSQKEWDQSGLPKWLTDILDRVMVVPVIPGGKKARPIVEGFRKKY